MKKFNMVLKLGYHQADLLNRRTNAVCIAPFPVPATKRGYPTRVAFTMWNWQRELIYSWEGKPTREALARLQRLAQSGGIHRVRACEYDRKNVIMTLDSISYVPGNRFRMFPVRVATVYNDYHPWGMRENGFFGTFQVGNECIRANGSKMGFYAPTVEQGLGYIRLLLHGIVGRGIKVI